MKRNKSCFHSVWIGWITFCRAINDAIELYLENHTRFITKHYRGTIVACILFVLIMAVGGVRFKAMERNEELFIPQGSQAFIDLDVADKYYMEKYRANDVMVSFKDSANKNVFEDNLIFEKLLELHNEIVKIADFKDVCIKSDLTKDCLVVSPLDVFNFNMTQVKDADTSSKIRQKFNARLQNWNLLFPNGRHAELMYGNLFGLYVGNDTHVMSGNSVRLTYYMNYLNTFDTGYDKHINWEEKYLDLCDSKRQSFDDVGLRLDYFAARTADDSVLESTVGDLPLFSVAFILMVLFCLLVFFRCKNSVTGHVTVGIMGIVVIMLGVGTGFGLAMWTGTDFVAFTGILIFLILGIGMDNMFIIVDAIEQVDPDVQGPERIVKAMKHVGGSITMTTSTDLVAFAVSTVTDFPAVYLFCVYASLSIFFAYLGLITLFLALLTWDVHRVEAGKRDLCACCKAKDKPENPWLKTDIPITRKLLRKWGTLLMKWPMKVLVMLAACGLLAAGIYGTTKLPRHFAWKKLSTDGSYFRRYAETRDDNFPQGYPVSVITPESLDYTLKSTQDALIALDQIAIDNPKFLNTTLNWMTMYKAWAKQTHNVDDLTGENFYTNLTQFRTSFQFFNADIILHSPDYIFVSRVLFFYENNNDFVNQADAMTSIRDDLKTKAKIEDLTPITLQYIYNEQILKTMDATIRNLAISGAAIVLITLPYLMHPGITGLVFLSFTSLIFELMGLMTAWDVSLDAIAMVVIIMAIGFSVDYTCHIAHSYMISTKPTPNERAIDALETMGVSVLNGGISTFLGMLITAFSQAEGFRIFFKMVFGIVLLGLIHGLIFLPVLLTIFVRRDLRADMKMFIEKHDKRDQKRESKRQSRMSTKDRRRESLKFRRSSLAPAPDHHTNGYQIPEDREKTEYTSPVMGNGLAKINETYDGGEEQFRITDTFQKPDTNGGVQLTKMVEYRE